MELTTNLYNENDENVVIITNLDDLNLEELKDKIIILSPDLTSYDKTIRFGEILESDNNYFPEVSDWIAFVKRFDQMEDESTLIRDLYLANSEIIKFDGYSMRKNFPEIISDEYQSVQIIFDKPINFLFGIIGPSNNESYITYPITELMCDFSVTGSFSANGLQKEYVNKLELYLESIRILK